MMAVETVEDIYQRIKDDPAYNVRFSGINGVQEPVTGAQLEAELRDTAAGIHEGQLREEQQTLRRQVRTALTQLAAGRQKLDVKPADRQAFASLPLWGAATQAQKAEILRIVADETLQDLAGTITVLIDLALIERENGDDDESG
jgi:hypothetical protein